MEFMGVGPLELMVILVLALVVFGPDKLPGIARNIGRGVAEFRRMSRELTAELSMQLEEETRAKEASSAVKSAEPLPLDPPQESLAVEDHASAAAVDDVAAVASTAPFSALPEETVAQTETKLPASRRRTHRKSNWEMTSVAAPTAAAASPAVEEQGLLAPASDEEGVARYEAGGSEIPSVETTTQDVSGEAAPGIPGAAPAKAKRPTRRKSARTVVASVESVPAEAAPPSEGPR